MNIIVLGASGFLGSKVYNRLRVLKKYNTCGTCFKHKQNSELIALDVIEDKEVEKLFSRVNPDIVLWSILSHDYSMEDELTHKGLNNIIKYMKKSCKLIYITTDGFAESKGNYSEEDLPSYMEDTNPINLYVKAKIEAEGIVKKLNNYIIARTGPLYGMDSLGIWDKRTAELIENLSHSREIVRTSNLYKTFVNVDDLAAALVEMIQIDFTGVIHIGPENKESYYSYNIKMAEKLNLDASLIKENCISKVEAIQRLISLDTSMNTSKCRKVLKTRFRSIDEYMIRSIPKGEIKMEVFAKPAASGIIERTIDGVEYVLIQDRFKENAPMEDGLIEIPGGKVREFENIYDCLRREIKEETGLEVIEIDGEDKAQIIEFNGYRVISYTPFSSAQNIFGYYPIMVNVFVCRVRGELLIKSDESKNIRWVPMIELNEMLNKHESNFYPMHVAALKKYVNYKIGGY